LSSHENLLKKKKKKKNENTSKKFDQKGENSI